MIEKKMYVKKLVRVGHMLYIPLPTAEARKRGLSSDSLVDLHFVDGKPLQVFF